METTARTRIIVSNAYDADRIAGLLRESGQTEPLFRFLSSHETFLNGHSSFNNFIHPAIDLRYFFGSEVSVKMEVALRFLFLNV